MGEPNDPEALAAALGRVPSGLVVLTARHGARETGMLASWVQQCSFDPPQVEAHLVARWAATCRVGGRTFRFAPGESIHADTSYKYGPETFHGLAAEAGWKPVRCWLDEDGLFALHLLRA